LAGSISAARISATAGCLDSFQQSCARAGKDKGIAGNTGYFCAGSVRIPDEWSPHSGCARRTEAKGGRNVELDLDGSVRSIGCRNSGAGRRRRPTLGALCAVESSAPSRARVSSPVAYSRVCGRIGAKGVQLHIDRLVISISVLNSEEDLPFAICRQDRRSGITGIQGFDLHQEGH